MIKPLAQGEHDRPNPLGPRDLARSGISNRPLPLKVNDRDHRPDRFGRVAWLRTFGVAELSTRAPGIGMTVSSVTTNR
jgi:hypothetical protein